MRTLTLILGLFTLSTRVFSQEAYTIQESNTGLRSILYNPLTESKAEELQDVFDLPSSMALFQVFGTDISPLLGFTNNEEGIQLAYTLSKSLAQDSADHFLLLFKEKPTDENITSNAFRYRIHIQWPQLETYDTLSSIIKESIRYELESSINQLVLLNSVYFSGNAFAEGVCIDQFIEKIRQINLGGLTIGENTLLNAGFIEIPIDGADIENTSTLDVNAFDFAGLKDGSDFIKDNFIEAAEQLAPIFTITNIITDNDAIGSGLFNSANTAFGLASSDIVAWYHYFESSEGNKLYCKSRNTISMEQSRAYIDTLFKQLMIELNVNVEDPPITFSSIYSVSRSGNPCFDLLSWSAKICLLDKASQLSFLVGGSVYNWGVMCGVIDGFYKTVIFIYNMSEGITQLSKHIPFTGAWCVDLLVKVWNRENFKNYGFGGIWHGMKDKVNSDKNYFQGLYASIASIVNSYQLFFSEAFAELKKYFNDITFQNGTADAGYAAGQAVFEVIIFALTGGASSVSQLSKISAQSLTKLKSAFNGANFGDFLSNAKSRLSGGTSWMKCKILLGGCFVAGTGTMIASNTIGNSGNVYLASATIPYSVIPIEDVPLLSYVVAHSAINKPGALTASLNHEEIMELTNNDPLISSAQMRRDRYVVNDTNWYAVSFEGQSTSSDCQLALTLHWINRMEYVTGKVVHMSLPEQGISGPFRISSITHITPQKKPVDEDPNDEWVYQPVTGLFRHQSDQVHSISFDTGDTLGVTAPHPIFSTTYNDWRLAGELTVGERVLTYRGEATVVSNEKKAGREIVYNLEVKDLHNFMVGAEGVVVHNSCIDDLFELFKDIIDNKGITHILRGEINNIGKATGVHHISAINLGTARKISGTQVNGPYGLYKVKVEVKNPNGIWVAKLDNLGYSTFFPDNWDQIRVLQEIKHAKNGAQKIPGTTNTYKGYSIDEQIEIHMYLKTDGTIISAFPIF